MTPEQFAYWMQGYVELMKGKRPTAEQWKMIADHLKTVFKKETPDYSKLTSAALLPFDTGTRIC